MFAKCSFNKTENKLDYYREIDRIKKLWENLKVHALKIINYKEKEILPLENKSYEEQKVCHICKKKFPFDKNEDNDENDDSDKNDENENDENDKNNEKENDGNDNNDENDANDDDNDENDEKFKKYQKIKDHCHYTGKFRGTVHSKCKLKYQVPKSILIVTHNAGYDAHFIINQLPEEFKSEFDCIGKNMEQHITFLVPIKKTT